MRRGGERTAAWLTRRPGATRERSLVAVPEESAGGGGTRVVAAAVAVATQSPLAGGTAATDVLRASSQSLKNLGKKS